VSNTNNLDGATWGRLWDETKRALTRERLPEADAEDLASALVIEALRKLNPEAWLRSVRAHRAADWHVAHGVVGRVDPIAPAPAERRKQRHLSNAQREVLRHWFDLMTSGLEELWAFYAGGEAGPKNVAEALRRRHERVLAGKTSVEIGALKQVVAEYAIPSDFDILMTNEVRTLLDTGDGRWIESSDHRPTPRRGRPTRERHLSSRTVWQRRRESAMLSVARAAIRLVAPAVSAALMNQLEKAAAATHRMEIKRLAKIYVAVRDGTPLAKRGRPKKFR